MEVTCVTENRSIRSQLHKKDKKTCAAQSQGDYLKRSNVQSGAAGSSHSRDEPAAPSLSSADCRTRLRHRDLFGEVHVLDGVEELGAFAHGALERLAAGDEAHAAAALVDDGGADGVGQVARALRLAARVDEAAAAHEAVGDLVADEVDGVIARQVGVNLRVGLAVGALDVERVVAAVALGQLLLDDVGLDGDAEVISLTREVCGRVHVALLRLELRVAEVAPQYRRHAEFV